MSGERVLVRRLVGAAPVYSLSSFQLSTRAYREIELSAFHASYCSLSLSASAIACSIDMARPASHASVKAASSIWVCMAATLF